MKSEKNLSFLSVFILPVLALFFAATAWSAEIDCLTCHGDLVKKKVKHPAVDMGCPSCHSAVDAADIPHKMTNKVAKGLSAEQPDLCYGCHDKAQFTKKTVHPALSMGCTTCHNPHASDNPRMLTSPVPDLCFTCHDKAEFSRKNVHPPVAAGKCLTCHSPHSSDSIALLRKEPAAVCLDCHAAVQKEPHAIRGFSSAGHPLSSNNKQDPKRPGRPFYCGSCHNPHSSDSMRLFRYPAKSKMSLCVNCHTY